MYNKKAYSDSSPSFISGPTSLHTAIRLGNLFKMVVLPVKIKFVYPMHANFLALVWLALSN